MMMASIGLSPPVRGTACRRSSHEQLQRFIPARAGNRADRHAGRPPRSVYPRPCGEQRSVTPKNSAISGLSPPVRGTELEGGIKGALNRFIPARAGNSPFGCQTSPRMTVYPRPCGEQTTVAELDDGLDGLSPPVRGTELVPHQVVGIVRFIPARAGNRHKRTGQCDPNAVYPRPCGEQAAPTRDQVKKIGLSPPVRGTVQGLLNATKHCRFIPARAGNRSPPASAARRSTVYPRPCGEQRGHHPDPGLGRGLSPPVRGTGQTGRHGCAGPRFIPARAGNSSDARRRSDPWPVYPRPCGEQSKCT